MKNQILMLVIVLFSFIVLTFANSYATGDRPGVGSGGTNRFTCTDTECTCDLKAPKGNWDACKGMAKSCKALGTDTVKCTYTIGKGRKVTNKFKIDGRTTPDRGGTVIDHRKPPRTTDHRTDKYEKPLPRTTDHRTDKYSEVNRTTDHRVKRPDRKRPTALVPGRCVCEF